jgi:hypothetical protein
VPAQGNRIVMINIAVNELEQSRRFHEEILDVEFTEERHDDGPVHLNATFGDSRTGPASSASTELVPPLGAS